ncbi:MAG: right-handed parallel beta-helix repeat-containing protein [Flavobacteriales bacterium]|nr:right-handed parallel beta-helix repeat-containing protein [Flavobacteriales bacterium]
MRISLRTLVVVATTAMALRGHAVIYYVSANGSDSNNGTSQSTPWKTIDRVNQSTYSIVPGDQVLFERGGTYRGEIIWGVSGTASQPVTYGAYGTGAAPIVSGAKLVTGWTLHSGNIYKAYVGLQVDFVYVSGARMELARTPNAGSWYRNSSALNSTLTSSSITQSSGFFTGARCVLRSTASSVDTLRVTNHSGSTLTFGSNPVNIYMNQDNWGFYLENKLSLLDAANEWFYDKNNGYLYLWAPGNVNPSTLSVEASVYWSGVNCYPSRHYGTIQNLSFRNQRYAGVLNGSADHVTVTGCVMEDVYHGIRSYGSYDNYSNNIIRRTYASGCLMIDNNSVFENNTLTDIALILGQGETGWGYFGIRGIGQNNTIRGNRFDNVGYSPIVVDGNHLVEKNVLNNYCISLNDGGGIAFDNANGMIIQDNIVRNAIGGLDGSSTLPLHYQQLGVGIYFGNTNIVNTTVQRNTVYNIPGIGINVDHCMNTVNNKVKDNVVFNADIGMAISDYSNTNGPFAVAPYHVPSYNDEITGNTIYALGKDKLCIKFFNCYSANYVDFGTFANNKYYSPYNEICIFSQNLFSGAQKWYTLEKWQIDRNEDAGSTRSPLRQTELATTGELSGNLVINGDFTTNITGWVGWPSNAQITRVTTHLDNGCLKAYLPDATVYPNFSMRNPDWFSLTNGQWYRMRISLQSNAEGFLKAGLKAQSTLSDPYAIGERIIPFGPERRDLEIYYQSNLTDQAQIRLINDVTEPLYYVDNIDVRRVSVQTVDPLTLHTLKVNDQATAQNFTVPAGGCWKDMAGNILAGGTSFTLQPYTSRIFFKLPDNQCVAQPTNATVGAKVFLGGAINWTTNIMRDDLRVAGLIPSAEPLTGQGWILENAGATISGTALTGTGNSAIVDWVTVELRNNNQTYTVAARRACLIRKDGTLISPDGNPVITFATTTTVGKYLVVYHRNHLGVMSGSTIATDGQIIDFTVSTTSVYGTDAMQVNGTRRALWSGNTNSDIYLKYTGSGNDRDPVLTTVGSTVPTGTVAGYRREDVNMDGTVKYIGTGNDRDPILSNIGGTIPTTTKIQQVP